MGAARKVRAAAAKMSSAAPEVPSASACLSRLHQCETCHYRQAECADNFHSMRPPARPDCYQTLIRFGKKNRYGPWAYIVTTQRPGLWGWRRQPERLPYKLIRGETSGPGVRIQLRFRNRRAEARVRHFDAGADTDHIIELRHIGGSHSDATIAGGPADQALLRRAVDVNVPRISLGI